MIASTDFIKAKRYAEGPFASTVAGSDNNRDTTTKSTKPTNIIQTGRQITISYPPKSTSLNQVLTKILQTKFTPEYFRLYMAFFYRNALTISDYPGG